MRAKSLLLIALIVLLGAVGCKKKSKRPANQIDTTYITDDFYAAFIIHPRRISEAPALKGVPWDKMLEQLTLERGQEEIPDLRKIEQVIALAGPPVEDMPVGPGVIIRFSDSETASSFFAATIEKHGKKQTKDGTTYYAMPGDEAAATLADKQTVLISHESLLFNMLKAKNAKSPLLDHLAGISADNDLIGAVMVEQALANTKDLVSGAAEDLGPFAGMVKSLEEVKTATLIGDLRGATLLSLSLECASKESAENIKTMMEQMTAFAKIAGLGMKEQAAQAPKDAQPLVKMGVDILNGIEVTQEDTQVSVTIKKPEGFDQLGEHIGPAMDVAMGKAKQAATDSQHMNDLKQIALGFLNYHDTHGQFPAAAGKEGEDGPAISWRVRLLPFLEGSTVWDEYNKKEPWDSDHNLKLAESFDADWLRLTDGKTRYLVFTGPGTVFEEGKKINFAQIVDGSSLTLLAIEAPPSAAVPWSKPADLVFDPANPLAALGEIPERGLLVAFCDGSVQRLSKEYLEQNLKAIITRNGGEEVDFP